MTPPSHITTADGLISAAFIENIREPGSRQRGVEPESFALPRSEPPKSPAAMEDTIAAAWELLPECLDAELDPDGKLRVPLSRRGWPWEDALQPVEGSICHTVIPSQKLDERMASTQGVPTGSARSPKNKSPHDLHLAFLNASPTDLWELLSVCSRLHSVRQWFPIVRQMKLVGATMTL